MKRSDFVEGFWLSAISAGRTLLAWERVLRLGGVAPRKVDSGPECIAKATSQLEGG